MLNSFVKLK